MTGSRNGWIMFALVFTGLATWMLWEEKKAGMCWIALAALLATGSLVGAYFASSVFAAKVDVSLMAFQGNLDSFDVATSGRVPIWNTAARMFVDNPVSGVGVRGFRYAYRTYADQEKDPYISNPEDLGAYHPHLFVLEIGAETGIIGLIGFILALGLLIHIWYRAGPAGRSSMLPYALALLAAFFPFNSHYALYSSDLSAAYFWLVALFCAAAGWRESTGRRAQMQPFPAD
jgi:O-antigen ligase